MKANLKKRKIIILSILRPLVRQSQDVPPDSIATTYTHVKGHVSRALVDSGNNVIAVIRMLDEIRDDLLRHTDIDLPQEILDEMQFVDEQVTRLENMILNHLV